MDPTGPICQQCVDARNTKLALEQQQAGNSGNGGNNSAIGKSGKISHSTKAPAVVGAALAMRSNGANKAQIARGLKISHNTVDKILRETEFDSQVALGRAKAVGLIPEALDGVKKAFAKGDGPTSCRFLEGVGVIGKDAMGTKSNAASDMQAIFNQCQVLINEAAPAASPNPEEEITISAKVVNDNPAKDPDSHED
jgi:hypothetical protein